MRKLHPTRKCARNFVAECQWILKTYKGHKTGFEIASLAFTGSLYHIWKERNQRHFNNVSRFKRKIVEDIAFEIKTKTKMMKTLHGSSVLQKHLTQIWDLQLNAEGEKTLFIWPKPTSAEWVLSCDGSLTPTRAGYGGLLRDSNGETIIGYAGLATVHHVLSLELHALLQGLLLVRNKNIDTIIVQMDSKVEVEIVKESCACPWRVLCVVRKIKYILSAFSYYHIDHVARSKSTSRFFWQIGEHQMNNFSYHHVISL